MKFTKETSEYILDRSVQINNGLAETCGDGASLAFDTKYGIMFCAYMPGHLGDYGESRGKISLSCFPASQPTNIRFREMICEKDVYAPNILSLGDGKVRVFYERMSRDPGDHVIAFKDYDFITDTLSGEKAVQIRRENGELVPYNRTNQKVYLEENGGKEYVFRETEQTIVGGCTLFRDENGTVYGSTTSELSDAILFRSDDNMETVEFFAVFPYPVQYELDYCLLNGVIYTIYRTDHKTDGLFTSVSYDMGKSWTEPVALKDSITCRPRILVHQGHILYCYNIYEEETGNRPFVIQGRTALRFLLGEKENANENEIVGELYSKHGMVNIAAIDILNDVYLAYSTSELALEYQNGTPWVRGKDAVRYIKLGDMILNKEK